jgi:hypothetical protein
VLWGMLHHRHACFRIWPLFKVGKTGGRSIAHLLVYVRPRGRPSGMLPSTVMPAIPGFGPWTAHEMRFEGRTSGLITQPRYRRATDPAPACPNVRCASVSPRRQGHYHLGIGGGDKDREIFLGRYFSGGVKPEKTTWCST